MVIGTFSQPVFPKVYRRQQIENEAEDIYFLDVSIRRAKIQATFPRKDIHDGEVIPE